MTERIDNTVICQYRPTLVEDRAMGPGMAFPHFDVKETL
jgi:hypothetical protein